MARDVSQPYRVVFCCDSLEVGGAERVLGHLAAELPESAEVVLMARDRFVLDTIASEGRSVQGTLVPLQFWPAVRFLRTCRPDLVHANLNLLTGCRRWIFAALALRIPVVLVDHLADAGLTWRGRLVQRLVTRRCAARVAVGIKAARSVELFTGLPNGLVRTIPNGVPHVAPAVVRNAAGPCVFGALGRIDPQKGLDLLLEALARLPDARLEIMGAGIARDGLEAMARDLGLTTRVTFTPYSPDTRSFWNRVDVLTLPSRSEANPLVTLEAIQYGRPVIATDVGSVSETVDDDIGVVIPPGDVDALGEAMTRLAEDADLRARMREAALSRARTAWSAADMAAEYDRLYRSVLARK
jgi:glycosyltransferase involved in cell wall biosynthesis